MFGWLENRLRKENLKLVRQNQLAAEYLHAFASEAASVGDPNSNELCLLLAAELDTLETLLAHLHIEATLSEASISDQLTMQKSLRRIYDQVLTGRRAFAQRFGSASEPLLSFDRKFVPNEGWQNFISHFDAAR